MLGEVAAAAFTLCRLYTFREHCAVALDSIKQRHFFDHCSNSSFRDRPYKEDLLTLADSSQNLCQHLIYTSR